MQESERILATLSGPELEILSHGERLSARMFSRLKKYQAECDGDFRRRHRFAVAGERISNRDAVAKELRARREVA